MNYSANVTQTYKKTGVETANQGKLIIMLYQGAIKYLNIAEKLMKEKEFMQANDNMLRVQAIVNELRYSLNHEKGEEMADNLYKLYEFMYQTLVEANMDKDFEKIELVRNMLKELLESWQEVYKKNADNNKKNHNRGLCA